MTQQEQDVLGIVKKRLKFEDDQSETVMTYVEEVGRRIKHYCNITTIPGDLNYAWASIVQHLVFYIQKNYDGEQEGMLSSIKIGDTDTGETQTNKIISPAVSNSMIDDVILNFKADLNHYRRMRW